MPAIPVVAIILAIRAAIYIAQGQQGADAAPPPPGTVAWNTVWGVWALEAIAVLVLVVITPVFPPAILGALALVAVMFPWLVVRYCLVPFGAVRFAHRFGQLSTLVWRRDWQGGGLVAGARALLRQEQPRPDDVAWLEDRLAETHPVLPGTLLAAGLLAWGRGQHVVAKRLIEGIGWYRPDRIPDEAFAEAREWLVIEAVTEGDWERAARLGKRDSNATSLGAQFLSGVAQHMVGSPNKPTPTVLWMQWAFVPGRALTRPLVEQALRARPPATAVVHDEVLGEPLIDALRLHAAVSRKEAPVQGDLVRLAKAWDRVAADPEVAARLTARSAELGARTGATALPRFLDEVRGELQQFAERGGVALHDLPGTGILASAVQSARDVAIRETELMADALGRRVDGNRGLPGIEEAREFLQLVGAYERVGEIGGVSAQRLVFQRVHTAICAQAVQLFNKRGEKPLANAMFRWLLEGAKKAGTQTQIELQTKNAACGF